MVADVVAEVQQTEELYGQSLNELEEIADAIMSNNSQIANLNADKEELFKQAFLIFDSIEGEETHVSLLLKSGLQIGRQKRKKPGTDVVDIQAILNELEENDSVLYNEITTLTRIFDDNKFELLLKKQTKRSNKLAALVKKYTVPLDHSYARICQEATKKVKAELAAAGTRVLRLVA